MRKNKARYYTIEDMRKLRVKGRPPASGVAEKLRMAVTLDFELPDDLWLLPEVEAEIREELSALVAQATGDVRPDIWFDAERELENLPDRDFCRYHYVVLLDLVADEPQFAISELFTRRDAPDLGIERAAVTL